MIVPEQLEHAAIQFTTESYRGLTGFPLVNLMYLYP